MSNAWLDSPAAPGEGVVRHRIGTWDDEGGRKHALIVTITLRVGDSAGDLSGRGFKTIEHEPVKPGALGVSFTHEENERAQNGRWMDVGGGAGAGDVESVTEFADGWDAPRAQRLKELASRWHLNTLKAGCAHMTLPQDQSYDARKDITCEAGTGYKYGSAWLVEPLPAEVLSELVDAFGAKLP